MARFGSKAHKKSAAHQQGSHADVPTKKKKQENDPKKKLFAVGVVVFGVLMALGMMLPSLAPIFSHQEQERAAQDAQKEVNDKKSSDSSSDSKSDSEHSDSSSDDKNTSKDSSDPQQVLQGFADRYEDKLKADPKDLAALLNLGNTYLSMGQRKISESKDGVVPQEAVDVLIKAVSTYDQYLQLNDSNAVRANRAMALHYMGSNDKAKDSLQAIVDRDDSFAPAYVDLGIIAAAAGSTDDALSYYQKALNADPDDQYGTKSMVNARIMMLTSLKNSKEGDDSSK